MTGSAGANAAAIASRAAGGCSAIALGQQRKLTPQGVHLVDQAIMASVVSSSRPMSPVSSASRRTPRDVDLLEGAVVAGAYRAQQATQHPALDMDRVSRLCNLSSSSRVVM